MAVRHILCHFIIFTCLVTFLFSIMYYVVSDNTYPSKFCNPDLCDINLRHVGCHPPGFSLICLKPRSPILATAFKRFILSKHNKLRNHLALGRVPGLSAAARIAVVTWNNDLAYLATINSKECALRYDECRNTKAFPQVGQNIANQPVGSNKINSEIIDNIAEYIIETLWFGEYITATQSLMNNYSLEGGIKIQNFSNIIHERTIKIGCGMTTYYSLTKKLMLLFVCNYSFRPYPGLPIYTSGPSCSKCKSKCDYTYHGLCSASEPIISNIY